MNIPNFITHFMVAMLSIVASMPVAAHAAGTKKHDALAAGLEKVASECDVEGVRFYLKYGAILRSRPILVFPLVTGIGNGYGNSKLSLRCSDTIGLLLEAGANPLAKYVGPRESFRNPAWWGSAAKLEAADGLNAYEVAVEEGQLPVVKLMRQHVVNANPPTNVSYREALMREGKKRSEICLEAGSDFMPSGATTVMDRLVDAISKADVGIHAYYHLQTLAFLRATGGKPAWLDACGRSHLTLAVKRKNPTTVALLLAHGGTDFLGKKDIFGKKAEDYALEQGDLNMVKALNAPPAIKPKELRPWLGLEVEDVTSMIDKVERLSVKGILPGPLRDLEVSEGVAIYGYVTSVNGHEVNRKAQLEQLIAPHKPGDLIDIGFDIDGKQTVYRVLLDSDPYWWTND